ncbi:lipid A biosynthesis lauroyl acyltransferase [Chitiniphilus purpureus]|uniref:Lipid A biosynthesis lauroyl acyltransferase n=1 Tax=Chitiniphilus purpureus TaxID=2981137 RepID=A0ABY6DP89_9NEIS|nr:lipid A biosynthesis lauroyl acyltransferase [Chitiniphilus sp. CD1]UXY15296.1 lipid A biosynthesis lauroyl acyltransferase [Chitiniphilus sp. CD1]
MSAPLRWSDLSWRAKALAVPFWVLHWLPFPLLCGLGTLLGVALYLLTPRRRHIGLVNLRLCFPEWSETERRRTLRRHYQVFAICLVSYGIPWFAKPHRLARLVVRQGYEHYAATQGRPIIALAPHFLGLDVGGIRHAIEHLGAILYTSTHESVFDQLLRFGRSRFGPPQLFRRTDGIRPVVRALRDGASLYYLPDQDLGRRESIFVPFFGVPTATVPALSRLAQLGDAVVVPMVTTLEGTRFVTRFYPAWTGFPSGDAEADTRRMNAFIEARVRECPAQYYWLHRRFKTRPEGESDPYRRVR